MIEANEEGAREYERYAPIPNKFLNSDGTISTLDEILGGGSSDDSETDDNGELPIEFTSVDLPPTLANAINASQALLSFRTRDGNYYINCSSSVYAGVFYFNVPNKTFTKLDGPNHYAMQNWFEDSKGNVYCSSTSSYIAGLFRVTLTELIQLNNNNFNNYLAQYEHNGKVYFGSNTAAGLLAVDTTTFAVSQLVSNVSLRYFFGSSDGTVYASGSNANTGVYAITENGTTATQISNVGTNWGNYYESKNGRIFVSSMTSGTANI